MNTFTVKAENYIFLKKISKAKRQPQYDPAKSIILSDVENDAGLTLDKTMTRLSVEALVETIQKDITRRYKNTTCSAWKSFYEPGSFCNVVIAESPMFAVIMKTHVGLDIRDMHLDFAVTTLPHGVRTKAFPRLEKSWRSVLAKAIIKCRKPIYDENGGVYNTPEEIDEAMKKG